MRELRQNSNETGVFLFKDRIADLKFTEHAQRVLEKYPIYIAMNFLKGMFKVMAEFQKIVAFKAIF